jgi:hypothetical protein
MAQTVANLTDVLKEAWTQDRLEKQFDDQTPFLDRIEKMSAEVRNTKIGEKAIVPIHKGRSGGYTSTSSAGGSLNAADEQKVDSAEYTLVYNWFQIALETGALNQSVGGQSSVVVAKDLEIEGAISDMAKQNMRQVATASDGVLAACDTGGASATVELLVDSSTSYGYQAIVRGWLYPGLTVDIGATSNTDSIVAGATIVSVSESSSDPDIVIDSSVSTTSGTDFVYIANPNSATAANPEINGLRSMVGSTTSALGGLDPDTAGEEFWKPAKVDTTTTVLSLDLLLDMQRAIHQKTGKSSKRDLYNVTGLKQEAAFYSLLQNQVRFSGDAGIGAGASETAKWNGLEIHGVPDILDTDWYMLTLSDFVKVTGQGIQKPTWVSDIEGSGGRLRWSAGTTAFNDAVVYPWQLGMKRRNGCAAAIGLTA